MLRTIQQAFYRAYRELIADRTAQMPFWMLVGFLATFVLARLTVRTEPSVHLSVQGVHVHHFTYGIIVLALVGFVSIAVPQFRWRRVLALAYGIGLALAFDEFGMWLRLTADYNIESSEDVMTGLLGFFVIAVYCTRILSRVLSILPHGWHREARDELVDKARHLHETTRGKH